MQDRLLSTKEAAEYLGFKEQTLANYRFLGKGPAYFKLGRRKVVYKREDLDEFIAKGRVVPTDNKQAKEPK